MLLRPCLLMLSSIACVTQFFDSVALNAAEPAPTKRIVFIAGGRSHDFGSHEHYAGCRILADTIQRTDPNAKCEVIQNGWPADDSMLDSADTIVIYSDGGGGR